MTKILTTTIDCVGRVIVFGAREDLVFTPKETALFTELGPVKAGLEQAGGQQSAGGRGFREGAVERQAAERAIRQDLRDIAEIAKALHERGIDVGALEAFRMPPNMSYAALAGVANGVIDNVESRKALFIERGLPATFVEDLAARIATLGTTGGAAGSQRGKQVGGTTGLDTLEKQAMAIVRELRSILRLKLRPTPALLAEWTAISRRHSPGYHAAAITPPAEPPPSGDTGSGSGS